MQCKNADCSKDVYKIKICRRSTAIPRLVNANHAIDLFVLRLHARFTESAWLQKNF